jgi:hypothetical protein
MHGTPLNITRDLGTVGFDVFDKKGFVTALENMTTGTVPVIVQTRER